MGVNKKNCLVIDQNDKIKTKTRKQGGKKIKISRLDT